MTWDPLLIEDGSLLSTPDWVPFRVTDRQVGDVLRVAVQGQLDAWTSGTLLRHLAAATAEARPSEVHLDLTEATCADRASIVALGRCRELAAERGWRRLLIVHPDPQPSSRGNVDPGRTSPARSIPA